MSIAHARMFVNMFFTVCRAALCDLFAEYANSAKGVIFYGERELFGLFGLTNSADSDKMIEETRRVRRQRRSLSCRGRHISQNGEEYEVNLAHTGRSAL